jgi:diguanylate cyclase (GGDEF)-like protein
MTVNEQLSALEQILARGDLHSLFQPIVSLSERRIIGYEALSRGPSNSPLHSPLPLFAIARTAQRLSELEMACRTQACTGFRDLGLEGKLFLNISPESLLESSHEQGRTLKLLQRLGIPANRIVIELTEQAPIDDLGLLDTALHYYRAMGFSIALDDLGAGYSSLRLWSELRPDYVKIDRHFIDGIHRDSVKREFVGSIQQMARASKAFVIAEGIELHDELIVLAEMGIDLVQGYLLSRPEANPPREAREIMPRLEIRSTAVVEGSTGLTSLLLEHPSVSEKTLIPAVMQLFHDKPSLNSLAVLDDQGMPIGIVHHYALAEALRKPFAPDLFGRKPITRLMHMDFLAVEKNHSPLQVSRLLTQRAKQRVEEDFIIVDAGKYMGMGRVVDLLQLITEQKIQEARHAHPLTGLPGSVPIHHCISQRLENNQNAILCHLDIDSFSPFNEAYGYAKGDEVLMCLAEALSECVDRTQDFIGHQSEDNFIIVLRSMDWRARLTRLMETFQGQCRRFYLPTDLDAGCLIIEDSQGYKREYPLLSLSLGVVRIASQNSSPRDARQLLKLAESAKAQAKTIPGYSLHLMAESA